VRSLRHSPRQVFRLTLDRSLNRDEITTLLRDLPPAKSIVEDHEGGRYVEINLESQDYAQAVEQAIREVEAAVPVSVVYVARLRTPLVVKVGIAVWAALVLAGAAGLLWGFSRLSQLTGVHWLRALIFAGGLVLTIALAVIAWRPIGRLREPQLPGVFIGDEF
jgi:hypothetical protein